MNREIKFRVWDGEQYKSLSRAINDELVGVQNEIKGYELEPFYDDVVLEQYTGLKDKNEKEIYEGDTVEVRKDYNYRCYDIIYESGRFRGKCRGYAERAEIHWLSAVGEIIGNIHEQFGTGYRFIWL